MIGVAILGAGIGAEHLAAYRGLKDRFEVRLVVDRDLDRAKAVAPDFALSDTIQTALDDPLIDVIDICLPPHLHVPTALEGLACGKHVICEKPIATSLSDIARLRSAVRRSGRSLFPVFQYRYGPAFAALRRLIDEGIAGPSHIGAFETHWARGPEYYAVPWRGTWAGEQGGAVLGHAIHVHDLLTHLLGPVADVSAMTTTRINRIETEDCAAILFGLESGAIATSSITLGAARDETRIRLVFEGLTATSSIAPYAPASGLWKFEARDRSLQAEIDAIVIEAQGAKPGYLGAFDAVADALSGSPGREVTFDEGASSIGLVTAIYSAARSGARVTLPLSTSHPMLDGWQPVQTV